MKRSSTSFVFCCLSTPALLCSVFLGASLPHARASIVPAPFVTGSAPAFNASFVAENTVDQTQNEYASATQGLDTFIEYSFGLPQTFDGIVVMNRDSPGQSDLIGDFTLTLDGATTASVTRSPLRGASQLHSLGGLRIATTVRLDVDTIGPGSDNNTGAMEVIFVRTPAGQFPISGVTILGAAPAFMGLPFFSPENAVDGDIGRSSAGAEGPEYASFSQGAATFVDFDLGAVSLVGGFDFFDRPHNADRVTAFDMIFSTNSTFGDGDDVVRNYVNANMALGDEFAPISAQYVRYDVTDNLGGPTANTGLSEMVFYQVPEPSTAAFLAFGFLALAKRRRR